MRTFKSILVGNLLYSEIKYRHRIREINFSRSTRVRRLEVRSFLKIGPRLTEAAGAGGLQDSSHGSRGSRCISWSMTNNPSLLLLGLRARPLRDFAFMVDIEGLSGRWVVHDLPVRRKLVVAVAAVFRGQKRRALFLYPARRSLPLSFPCDYRFQTPHSSRQKTYHAAFECLADCSLRNRNDLPVLA